MAQWTFLASELMILLRLCAREAICILVQPSEFVNETENGQERLDCANVSDFQA